MKVTYQSEIIELLENYKGERSSINTLHLSSIQQQIERTYEIDEPRNDLYRRIRQYDGLNI